ncbi:hypothetical protein EDB19DRAFT_1834191 [Suillus lakei]|nr:hypothetical protein EDB19DRAFT_1834191 [Suillus lakei]
MIWDDPIESEYPGVRTHLQRIKCTVMDMHNSIINAQVKQTVDTNKKQHPSPFIKGHPPTLVKLIGLEATRKTAPQPHDPWAEAGGKWLDPCHTELMDEALWDNLKRLKKQRKWKERGVAKCQAKRPSNTHAPSPFLTDNPPPPNIPAPEHPSLPEDADAKMMDAEATEAAKAVCMKVTGRIPKK